MANLLSIGNEEDLVEALIRKNFEKEIDHMEKMFDLFLRTYDFICRNEQDFFSKEDYAKHSIFLLFVRKFRILRSAYHSMLKGYYEMSSAIQRMAFENHMLMTYFVHRPEEAKKWFSGEKIGLRRLKREYRKHYSLEKTYGRYSNLVHANFETTHFFLKPKVGEVTIWTTDYVPADFYLALLGLSAFGIGTMLTILRTLFDKKHAKEPLLKEIGEFMANDKIILDEAFEKMKEQIKSDS